MQNLNFHQIPISSAPFQEMTFSFSETVLRLTLRFNSVGECWTFDLYDTLKQKQIAEGMGIVCGVPLLWRCSTPYFLWLEDENGTDLDPMTANDLNRFSLFIGLKP